ncbi:MAG: hypothetical protein AAFU64_07865 [Bacteroidota bacterium]
MTWNCINCESANDLNTNTCEVCGYERYFSISEVNELLDQQKIAPTEIKKIQSNYKRINTINKKLRQENKDMVDKMEDLQEFHDQYSDQMEMLKNQVKIFAQGNLRLKIWLAVSVLALLFFILAKVQISVQF